MNYDVQLCLTRFIDARVALVENSDGNMEECVCIPIDKNMLWKSRANGIYAYMFCNKRLSNNRRGWTHYLQQKVTLEHKKKLESLGYKVPYLGDMRAQKNQNFSQVVYQNDNKVKNDYGV